MRLFFSISFGSDDQYRADSGKNHEESHTHQNAAGFCFYSLQGASTDGTVFASLASPYIQDKDDRKMKKEPTAHTKNGWDFGDDSDRAYFVDVTGPNEKTTASTPGLEKTEKSGAFCKTADMEKDHLSPFEFQFITMNMGWVGSVLPAHDLSKRRRSVHSEWVRHHLDVQKARKIEETNTNVSPVWAVFNRAVWPTFDRPWVIGSKYSSINPAQHSHFSDNSGSISPISLGNSFSYQQEFPLIEPDYDGTVTPRNAAVSLIYDLPVKKQLGLQEGLLGELEPKSRATGSQPL